LFNIIYLIIKQKQAFIVILPCFPTHFCCFFLSEKDGIFPVHNTFFRIHNNRYSHKGTGKLPLKQIIFYGHTSWICSHLSHYLRHPDYPWYLFIVKTYPDNVVENRRFHKTFVDFCQSHTVDGSHTFYIFPASGFKRWNTQYGRRLEVLYVPYHSTLFNCIFVRL
jgi:hypothetical protein